MDGFLNIDKPAGMTSFDVVARVRRILKTKRAGHAGTLDPDAVGVLVIAVGQATRLLPYLPIEPKEYIARIAFGVATDTEDASGAVVAEADASRLTEDALLAVLPRLIGEISQIPPMVSAVHHEGKRLYELARAGITVERAPRPVTIHEIAASDFVPGERAEATLRVVCGGGTYIRTLCADIGAAVSLPAHMKTLVRTAVGPFRREDALTLETFAEQGENALSPMAQALPFPQIAVSDADAERLRRGQSIAASEGTGVGRWVLGVGDGAATPNAHHLTPNTQHPTPNTQHPTPNTYYCLLFRERLMALARFDNGVLQPFKVFGE